MRKLISYINSTLNGAVTGDPTKDKTNFMVWPTEASVKTGSECLLKTMQTVDTTLHGRTTYEDLSRTDKWPSVKDWPGLTDVALALGDKLNNAHTLVVTRDHPLDPQRWG